jgi:hypothetical protein
MIAGDACCRMDSGARGDCETDVASKGLVPVIGLSTPGEGSATSGIHEFGAGTSDDAHPKAEEPSDGRGRGRDRSGTISIMSKDVEARLRR